MAVRMLSKSYSGLERGPAVTSAAQQGGPARSKLYSGLERVRPVILSAAKDLARRMHRPFAALRMTKPRHVIPSLRSRAGSERSEGSGSTKDPSCLENLFVCHPERLAVILSAAKDLARRMERSFAAFRACPERSEGMTDMISKCLVDNSTICHYLHKRATMKPFHSME